MPDFFPPLLILFNSYRSATVSELFYEFLLTNAGFIDTVLSEFRECCFQFSLLENLH